MADTLKRLCGPATLATSAATVYTVPAATSAVIRDVHVCNETAAAETFTLSIGTDGSGKRLYRLATVEAYGSFQRTGNIALATGEVVQAFASASGLTLTISGVETA